MLISSKWLINSAETTPVPAKISVKLLWIGQYFSIISQASRLIRYTYKKIEFDFLRNQTNILLNEPIRTMFLSQLLFIHHFGKIFFPV